MRANWSKTETSLQEILTSAALGSMSLSERDKIKWRISVTEMEVRRGILDRSDQHRCLCVIRDIQDFKHASSIEKLDPAQSRMIGRHVELEKGPGIRVDESTQNKSLELRNQVKKTGVKCKEFTVKWSENGIQEDTHGDYMKEVGYLVYNFITQGVEEALSKAVKLDSLTQEIISHGNLCHKRGSEFRGRADLMSDCLEQLQDITGPRSSPMVIHGESGSGKTSFMSALAARLTSRLSEVTTFLCSDSVEHHQTQHQADSFFKAFVSKY